jgi:hypothetical protein
LQEIGEHERHDEKRAQKRLDVFQLRQIDRIGRTARILIVDGRQVAAMPGAVVEAALREAFRAQAKMRRDWQKTIEALACLDALNR